MIKYHFSTFYICIDRKYSDSDHQPQKAISFTGVMIGSGLVLTVVALISYILIKKKIVVLMTTTTTLENSDVAESGDHIKLEITSDSSSKDVPKTLEM